MNKVLQRVLSGGRKAGLVRWEFSFPGAIKVTHILTGHEGEYSTISGQLVNGIDVLEMREWARELFKCD